MANRIIPGSVKERAASINVFSQRSARRGELLFVVLVEINIFIFSGRRGVQPYEGAKDRERCAWIRRRRRRDVPYGSGPTTALRLPHGFAGNEGAAREASGHGKGRSVPEKNSHVWVLLRAVGGRHAEEQGIGGERRVRADVVHDHRGQEQVRGDQVQRRGPLRVEGRGRALAPRRERRPAAGGAGRRRAEAGHWLLAIREASSVPSKPPEDGLRKCPR